MRRALALAGACLGWAACASRPAAPSAGERLAAAARALSAGALEQAIELVRATRTAEPRLAAAAHWSAMLASMTWNDDAAIREMTAAVRLANGDDVALRGQLGDLLFAAGRWNDSVAPLQAGAAAGDGERRRAFAAIAMLLPSSRRPQGPLVTEQPLLPGETPEFVCGIGDRQRPFAIDTGTSMTTIGRTFAEELVVRSPLAAGSALDGAGRQLPIEVALLPSFAIGDVEIGATPVLVVDDAALRLRDLYGGPDRVPRGVLGLDLLGAVRLTLDPERGSVVIEAPRGLPEAQSVQCVRVDGRCLVPVAVEGVRLWFVLDSGASHSSLSEAGLAALPGGTSRAQPTFRRVRTVGGGVLAVREVRDLVLRCSEARCLGVTLPVVPRGAVGMFPVHGVLGLDLLRQCIVTLDRGRARLVARA